jgi:hypothetical protein
MPVTFTQVTVGLALKWDARFRDRSDLSSTRDFDHSLSGYSNVFSPGFPDMYQGARRKSCFLELFLNTLKIGNCLRKRGLWKCGVFWILIGLGAGFEYPHEAAERSHLWALPCRRFGGERDFNAAFIKGLFMSR